ncbi:MAG: FecR domain-containing protein, partial [Bdellovibrionales bacterium]|nr:FecR domain-containing protein [Bdellovibrionales bacterium]
MEHQSYTRLKFFDWLLLVGSLVCTCFFGYLLIYPEPVLHYFVHKDHSGKQIGVVSSASNDVRRRLNRSLTWYKVRYDEVIFENDTIFTGPGSEINIRLDDDVKFRLGENSLVVLSAAEDGTFELDLQLGNLVADVKGQKAIKLKGKV